MEHYLDLEKESSDGKKSGIPNGCSLHQTRQNKKLGHRLQFDKQGSYFDDFHPELTKSVDSPVSKYKGFHQKQWVERKVHQSEELVKYMSKLPSFLERGENLPEKAFNVGVLDWHLLEKWQLNRKEIIRGNGKHTPFSTNPSPISSKNEGKFHDCKAGPIHPSKVQQSAVGAHQSFSQDTENRLKEQRSEELDLPRNSEMRRLQQVESDSMASSSKGKMKVRHEAMMGQEELDVTSRTVTDHYCSDRNKTAVLFPKDGPENRFSAISDPPYSSKGGDQRSMDVNRHNLAGESSVCVCHADVPREANKIVSWLDHSCSRDANIKLSSEIKQTVKFPGNILFSPSSGKKLEEENLSLTSKTVTKNKSSDQELNPKTDISAVGKVRNSSPTRRFSFDMGKMGRSPSSKETSAIPHSGAKDFTVKSGSEVTSTSTCDKSNDTSRSRSSPLRRLLDPFLKPKAGISDHFGKSLERDSSTTDRVVKSSTVQGESPAFHSVSVKFDLKDCKTIDIDNPNNEKTGSSTVQAFLQVAVKNGLPLFTFTVDKKRDILAATVKNLSLRKNVNRWMYTFFSLQEMKKKTGHWINQGGKDRNHGYIPNVVAQMRVSDVFSSEPSRQRSVTKSRTREFVLFSVGTRDVNHQTSDMLPSDELAAIIMKFPGKIDRQINRDAQLSGNSKDDEGNRYLVPSADLLSTTVILPGGEHGLPGKGEPSPLIARWKSGSCDCGGWDMGCKIRVLDNHSQSSEKCSSTGGRFELFSQDEISETKPVFSLWFSDGIFPVEFSSSLELLQAFSIGIALFNGMKPAIFSEPDNFFGHKTSEEVTLRENNVAKISKQEVSAKYATLPPLSPVGRV